MKRNNLWSVLAFMILATLSVGIVSCGDDDNDVVPNGGGGEEHVIHTDTVLNNPNKLVVTGGLVKAELGYDDGVDWSYSEYSGERLSGFYADRFTVTLYGYANLLSEMKILLGNGLEVGIEVADNANFSNAHRAYATSIDANSKFTVTTWAQAGRTLYWRAFLLSGDMRQYEEARSISMPSLATALQSVPLELGEPNIKDTEFYVNIKAPSKMWRTARKVGLAYSENLWALTATKMKASLDKAEWSKFNYNYLYYQSEDVGYLRALASHRIDIFEVIDLQPATTYYYCEYLYVEDGGTSYLVVGDVQEVTTTGIGLAEVCQYVDVSITPDDANRQWKVHYTSTLESKYPQLKISYEIRTGFDVLGMDMDGYRAVCYNSTQMATSSSYSGTIPYPTLIALISRDDEMGYAAEGVIENLYETILKGWATDEDKKQYELLLDRMGAIRVANTDVPYFIQVLAIITGEYGNTLYYPVATGTCFGGNI